MSSAEFTEWLAYARLEPFGFERLDLGFAIVAATIANANRDPKQRPQPFSVEEFMPLFDREQSEERERAAMESKLFSALVGG